MATVLPEGKQSFQKSDGAPLVGGKLYTYAAGTSTPKATYADQAATVPNTNPIILDARGEATIYWSGAYKAILKDSADVTIWTVDNLFLDGGEFIFDGASIASFFLSKNNRVVDSIAALKALDKTKYTRAFVTGYYAAGDGGGGNYWYDSADTVSADNGGTIIVAADGGRWKLVGLTEINVKQFGAKGDNSTNDYAAIQAAATVALSAAKRLKFPAGKYICGSQIVGTGNPIEIVGDGKVSTRIIFNTTNGGIYFTLNPQSTNIPPQRASFSEITLEARAAVTSPALQFEWSAYQANAQGQFWANDFSVTRADDGTGSFTSGIKLNKCFVGYLRDFVILGDDVRTGLYGVQLTDCVGIRLANFDVNRYKSGVRIEKATATQTEGILIRDSFLYDVNKGIDSPHQAIHVNVVGTHININGASATACIGLVSASQSLISDCLLYFGGNPGDAANQDCIQLTGCNSSQFSNNFIFGITKANTRYGLATAAGSSYNSIEGNSFAGITQGLFIGDAADTSNRVFNNDFFSCTTDLTDSGTTTYKAGNTSTGTPISSVRWGSLAGLFAPGEISANANWGAYLRGYSGTSADVALVDNNNVACMSVKAGSAQTAVYAKASLPSVIGGGLICVTDDVGGYTLAFSDGVNWRRVADRAVIS